MMEWNKIIAVLEEMRKHYTNTAGTTDLNRREQARDTTEGTYKSKFGSTCNAHSIS